MKMIPERIMICCIENNVKEMDKFYSEMVDLDRIIILVGYRETWSEDAGKKNLTEDAVEKLINTKLGKKCEIVKANIDDFYATMRALNIIIKDIEEKGNEPYISIAGGTGEYCAAACIMGMTHKNAKVISKMKIDYKVKICDDEKDDNTDDGDSDDNKISRIRMEGGSLIERYDIPMPDQILLKAFHIYSKVSRGKRTSTNVIAALIKDGVWYKLKGENIPKNEYEGTSLDEKKYNDKTLEKQECRDDLKRTIYKEKNMYQRNVVGKWEKNGWIEKNDRSASGYNITKKGASMLYVFIKDEEDKDQYKPVPLKKYLEEKKKEKPKTLPSSIFGKEFNEKIKGSKKEEDDGTEKK